MTADTGLHFPGGVKRRRILRKGTHSCWACKRRKEKCVPSEQDDAACLGCQRRGIECVSQEFTDGLPLPGTLSRATTTDARLQRVEDVLTRLLEQAGTLRAIDPPPERTRTDIVLAGNERHADHTVPKRPYTDVAAVIESASPQHKHPRTTDQGTSSSLRSSSHLVYPGCGDLTDISQALFAALPSALDLQILRAAHEHRQMYGVAQIFRSYKDLEHKGLHLDRGLSREPPPVGTHPVLLARYLLEIAILIQMAEPGSPSSARFQALSQPPADIVRRCAMAAIKLVTTQDDLSGSLESLECVVLESVYHCNNGHLRLSWMAIRRAILLAQVMGVDSRDRDSQQNPLVLVQHTTRTDFEQIWFRIVNQDLLLCRLLGLTPAVHLDSFVDRTSQQLSPHDLLERKLCTLMHESSILQHTRQGHSVPSHASNLVDRISLAARGLPSAWWLVPNLPECAKDPTDFFWALQRLLSHMVYYDVLMSVHLPIMLPKLGTQAGTDIKAKSAARAACVTAARESLSRFFLLRSFSHSMTSCRVAELLAMMAAITLGLALLDESSDDFDGIRASRFGSAQSHRLPSDIGMIEQALDHVKTINSANKDVLGKDGAAVLQRLSAALCCEETIIVSLPTAKDSGTTQSMQMTASMDKREELKANVPGFGVIQITPKNKSNPAADDEAQIDCMLPGFNNWGSDWAFQGIDTERLDDILDSYVGFP